MKKGINIWSFAEGKPLVECMQLAKSAGFEGIELALGESGELALDTNYKQATDLKNAAGEIGIELPSLACGLYWDYSFTSSSAANRTKAFDIAEKQLELASWLGATSILLIPGAVGVDFIPGSEVVPYDIAYEHALEAVTKLAAVAEQHQVHISLENVWNKFLLSPLEFRDFIDKADSPYVGSYFDVGNVIASGYPEHWVSILNKRIRNVHFKDYRRQAGGLHGFVDLLAGDVNYPAVVEKLHEIGYDGYVTAEMLPPYTHYPDQLITNTSRAMDAILGRTEKAASITEEATV